MSLLLISGYLGALPVLVPNENVCSMAIIRVVTRSYYCHIGNYQVIKLFGFSNILISIIKLYDFIDKDSKMCRGDLRN